MERLCKLLNSYKNKISDEKFIFKFIDIMVDEMSLHGYIDYIEFDEDYYTAVYRFDERVMSFGFNNINKSYQYVYNYASMYTDASNYMFINAFLSKIILHELWHVHQNKQMDYSPFVFDALSFVDRSDSVDSLIECGYDYNTSITYINNMLSKFSDLYDLLHKVDPLEKSAEVFAAKSLVDILDMDDTLDSISKYYKWYLSKSYTNGYKEYYPLYHFLKGYDSLHMLDNFEWFDKDNEVMAKKVLDTYGVDKVLSYGLPISKDLYKSLKRDEISRTMVIG